MSLPADTIQPSSSDTPERPSLWNGRTRWLVIFLLALLWSLNQTGIFSGKEIVNSGGWPQFASFWRAAFSPLITPSFLALTLQATLVTLAYAVSSIFLALVIGILFSFLISEVWWSAVWPQRTQLRRIPWSILRFLLAIPRGIHELLWGLIFLNIFGLDPLAAILAIAIPYGATIAKVFAEIMDEAPQSPFQVLLNSGVSPLKAVLYGHLPGILPDWISYSFYRFECGIRAAAVLGVIGAGGLGYQILLSMQTLNYNETWTFFYALLLLSGLADAWSAQVRRRFGRTNIVRGEYSRKDLAINPPNGRSDPVIRWSIFALLVMVPISFVYLNPDWSLLWSERTARLLAEIASQAWPLNLTWIEVQELFNLSQKTLAMSILAAVLAAAGGAFLSFPAARNFLTARRDGRLRPIVINLTRGLLLLMRAVPAPIWALVLLFIFFPGMLPGVLALAIYNMGVLGRLMAEVLENMDRRPSEAIRALGAGGRSVFLYGTAPTITPRYVSYSLYRWENAIRETVIVGIVGAGGLGRELSQGLSAFNYRAVLAILICLILLTFAVDMTSSAVRRQLR